MEGFTESLDGSAETRRALVVDLGGPGLSLFATPPGDLERSLRDALGELADGRVLLLMEEPWVQADTSTDCRAELRTWYAARRAGQDAASLLVARACGLFSGIYGWRPREYAAALQAILDQEQVTEAGFAALSFGAVRYTYADDVVGGAVFGRPAAAPGTAAASMLAERASAIWAALREACACDRGHLQRRIDAARSRYEQHPVQLPARSLEVTAFDYDSALVSAALVEPASLPSLLAGRKAPAATVADLSDRLWMRYNLTDVSPAQLAYLDEMCPTYTGWDQVQIAPDDRVLAVLTSGVSDCRFARPNPSNQWSPPACIVEGANDTIAPAAYARTWTTVTRVTSSDRRHWFDMLQRCLTPTS